MKLLKLLAAALFALVPTAVIAAQATYTMPTTGPLSMSSYSADVNSALAAILSKNSGSSAPSVTGQPSAFQWWVDTSGTPRVLKLYDGTNWLTVGTIDTSGHLWGANASTLTLLGSSSGSTIVQPTAAASGTLTLPAATDTLVGKATTDSFTHKTFDTAGAGNSFLINGLAATANTGTGSVVRATSPALITPDLGTPSALTLTNATGLPVGAGISGLASGIATWLATPSSANLASAITDETGSGLAVFATSPSLTTPTLGVASATTVNKVTITAPATGSTLTIPNGVTLTGPASSGTAMTLGNAETVTGAKSFNSSDFILNGSSSGSTTVNAAATASGTLTLPAATDTLVGKATTDTLTNKTFDTAGAGNSLSINGVAATANTGTGAVARASSPTLTTPVFTGLPTGTGVASAATASTLDARDGNANISANAFLAGYATTATAAGTTTLVVGSAQLQYFTGSTTQTVLLPVTSTLVLGQSFTIVNNSSGAVAVQSSGANLVLSVAAGNTGIFTVVLTSGTTAASWSSTYISSGAGTGTVTSASVASANGFAGTVATPTTTPAITLSTSVSGVLKGNGTAISAATAGTDFVAPGAAAGLGEVGGRLTAATGTPVNTVGTTGATSVFFTPYKGAHIPIWNGSAYVDTTFSGDLSQALSDTTKSPAAAAASSVYDIFAWSDSGTLRISRGPAWSTLNVRGASANIFQTGGFGVFVNVSAITNGPAAHFGTYLGTIATNGSATLDFIHGGSASGGSAGSLMVWNFFNRVMESDVVFDTGTSYTYTTATWRQARASTGNQVAFIVGIQEDGYSSFYQQNVATTATSGAKGLVGISIGAGSLSIVAAAGNQVVAPTANIFNGSVPVFWNSFPTIGYSILAAIEKGDGTNANSFCTFGGAQLSFTAPM